MKHIKKIVVLALALLLTFTFVGCYEVPVDPTYEDQKNTKILADDLVKAQPTPTDIEYSLQRYNLIRRAYWMNGYEEKARSLPCEVDKPLGYIYLFLEGVGCVAQYTVDGQITSLRSYLTPDTTKPNYEGATWLADVDGTYGENQDGIFFFTVDGEYKEWNGLYHYSSTYYEIGDVMLNVKTNE
jgi:hypothetical protein